MEQTYTPLRTCPVCEKRSGTVLGLLTYALFDDLGIPGTKTLIQCSECGMMYDDVAFTEGQLQEYYRRNEHYAASSLGGSGSLSDDNVNRYDRIIDNLHPDPRGTILDVGCGQGGFVARCLHHGFSAAGIEPSEKSRNVGLNAGLDIYTSIEEYAARHPEAGISTVVISHVLEHLFRPLNMLKEIIHNAPEALVYIEVPDAASYLSPRAMRWYELYFEHLNHFCKDSFSNLAARSCIEVTSVESTPFSENQADVQCLFLVGRFRYIPDLTVNELPRGKPRGIKGRAIPRKPSRSKLRGIDPRGNQPGMVTGPRFTLPPLTNVDLLQDDRPIALWGVSQYAMLLMGSLPQLERVDRLFDASPAKIGRKIRGITIEDAREIGTLPKETILVLPYSQYSLQMRKTIEQSASFAGKIIQL